MMQKQVTLVDKSGASHVKVFAESVPVKIGETLTFYNGTESTKYTITHICDDMTCPNNSNERDGAIMALPNKMTVMQALYVLGEAFCALLTKNGIDVGTVETATVVDEAAELPKATKPAKEKEAEFKEPKAAKTKKPVEVIPEEVVEEVKTPVDPVALRAECKAKIIEKAKSGKQQAVVAVLAEFEGAKALTAIKDADLELLLEKVVAIG
jgi:hypothetical protein